MNPRRIASLAPSQTDWLLDLGAADRLACVTSFCELPLGLELPRLKGWSNLKAADVLALKPDLVLTSSLVQAPLAAELKAAGLPVLHQDPRRLAEVRAGLLELGTALGLAAEAEALAVDWDRAWADLAGRAPLDAARPRVFVEEWHQPPMAAGNWVPDLVRAAGGEPFLTPPGSQSLEVSWEEVMEFDPQLVILSICGRGTEYAPEEWMKIEGWDRVDAAVARRVYSIDDSLFNRPSRKLLAGAELLQGMIGQAFLGWPRVEGTGIRKLTEDY